MFAFSHCALSFSLAFSNVAPTGNGGEPATSPTPFPARVAQEQPTRSSPVADAVAFSEVKLSILAFSLVP
jgi:hypothetical protein